MSSSELNATAGGNPNMQPSMGGNPECNRMRLKLRCRMLLQASNARMFHLEMIPAVEYGTCSPTGEHRDIHLLNGAVKYLPLNYLYDYDS